MKFKAWLKLKEAANAPMAIPLDKNPNMNPLIDPETGEDYSGANPYYDQDTGVILDAEKSKAWETKKREIERINRQIYGAAAGRDLAALKRKPIVDNASRQINDLLDSVVDGFIKHGIRHPMHHPAFKARLMSIIQDTGITTQEMNQIWRDMSGKLNYISSSIDNPERRQLHMIQAHKQFEKKIGVRPLNQ